MDAVMSWVIGALAIIGLSTIGTVAILTAMSIADQRRNRPNLEQPAWADIDAVVYHKITGRAGQIVALQRRYKLDGALVQFAGDAGPWWVSLAAVTPIQPQEIS